MNPKKELLWGLWVNPKPETAGATSPFECEAAEGMSRVQKVLRCFLNPTGPSFSQRVYLRKSEKLGFIRKDLPFQGPRGFSKEVRKGNLRKVGFIGFLSWSCCGLFRIIGLEF